MSVPNIQLLLTGNELMTGDIVDSNSAMIAHELKEIGVEVSKKVTVADNLTLLVDEIKSMAAQADVLIINGGLGPTIDDLTAQALAQASEVDIKQHPEALAHLTQWCQKRGATLSDSNLKQTMLPQGCSIIANEKGSAVGFALSLLGCDIYCTPGVPRELKSMLRNSIKLDIAKKLPNELISEVTRLQVFGLGESALQTLVDEHLSDWPQAIDLGFRAGNPLLEVKLSVNSADGLSLLPVWKEKLIEILADHFIAEVDTKPESLAQHVVKLLTKSDLKVTTAESCTGGLIASMLTSVPGSSQCFEAGFVTYSNLMKTHMLEVPLLILEQHGAVSKQVVHAMASGALKHSKADIAIAISGVAGPDGGTVDKPVGMVWLAWGDEENINTECLLLPFSRQYFQQYAAAIALDLVRRKLIGSSQLPSYLQERRFKPRN